MIKYVLAALLTIAAMDALAQSSAPGDGLIAVKSAHDVGATLDKLEEVLSAKGMTIFTRIDHQAGAEKVEFDLRPTSVLMFGNPKVGSPLMRCAQSVAIDLPQKALAWEDESGQVWLAYNDPQYLNHRHHLDEACAPVLEKISKALGNFIQTAAGE